MSPTRHAALCTCAPARMVAGAFCRHKEFAELPIDSLDSNFGVRRYECKECGVKVKARAEAEF